MDYDLFPLDINSNPKCVGLLVSEHNYFFWNSELDSII
jgi:hypothetical protein